MPSLFENAVASIRMGVEDFRQQDHDRDVSAVRNFYAGVLLLAKEALIRAAPTADPQIIIGAKLKPIPDGDGGVALAHVGYTTVDFGQVGDRARDFGITLDVPALSTLNKIRNDMEHRFTSEPATAIRAAISKGFPVVASLFRQLGEDPLQLLGEAWTTMLATKDVYDQELREARATLAKVAWRSPSIKLEVLKCDACQSELLEQDDPENDRQDSIDLRCKTCGGIPDVGVIIEQALDESYGPDAYIRARDTGDDGPLYQCPACNRMTLVEGETECANCGEPLDYEDVCARCGTGISIQDFLGGLDGGLCSYCAHMAEKVMRED